MIGDFKESRPGLWITGEGGGGAGYRELETRENLFKFEN